MTHRLYANSIEYYSVIIHVHENEITSLAKGCKMEMKASSVRRVAVAKLSSCFVLRSVLPLTGVLFRLFHSPLQLEHRVGSAANPPQSKRRLSWAHLRGTSRTAPSGPAGIGCAAVSVVRGPPMGGVQAGGQRCGWHDRPVGLVNHNGAAPQHLFVY